MEKLSNEFVKQYFKEQGCELLEEYKNSTLSMRYICICGNESKIVWSRFRTGRRCKACGNQSRKLDFNYILNYFKEQGCELLETIYLNNSTPMNYRCNCGDISKISWDRFFRGGRCKKCGIIKNCVNRLSYDYVNEEFKSRGYVLLEDKYINNHTAMRYICICGTKAKISFKLLKKGAGCRKCHSKKMSGTNSPRWNKNREMVKLNELLGHKYSAILRHTFYYTGDKKNDRSEQLLGYTRSAFREHIMNHINWNKVQGVKWDLDHIFPIKAFIEHSIFDCKIINSLDNLQPLEHSTNCSKSDNYNKIDFENWLKNKGIKLATIKKSN